MGQQEPKGKDHRHITLILSKLSLENKNGFRIFSLASSDTVFSLTILQTLCTHLCLFLFIRISFLKLLLEELERLKYSLVKFLLIRAFFLCTFEFLPLIV